MSSVDQVAVLLPGGPCGGLFKRCIPNAGRTRTLEQFVQFAPVDVRVIHNDHVFTAIETARDVLAQKLDLVILGCGGEIETLMTILEHER